MIVWYQERALAKTTFKQSGFGLVELAEVLLVERRHLQFILLLQGVSLLLMRAINYRNRGRG